MQSTPLSTRQAAERLGISVFAFHHRAKTRQLQPVRKDYGKRGTCWWDPADVERLAESDRPPRAA